MSKTLLAILGFLVALPTVGLAGPLITICGKRACDPSLLPIINPIPITPNSIQNVQPKGSSGETDYAFINLTGTILDNFAFDMTINKGLDETLGAPTVAKTFTCDQPSDYFLNCSVTYNDFTGLLVYQYSGVNPPDGDPLDTEVGQQEGIPSCPVLPGPTKITYPVATAACEALGGLGIFTIAVEGWTSSDSVGGVQLYSGLPKFTNAFNVPEPSAALILLTELLLLAGTLVVFGRRLKWKRRFDL